ncbi:MAG TPA: hypothetical protein VKB80_02965 [Kofleriaceae bacterium]|nr:hypothetical protein [Kofleriaceae bacterium]
MFGARPPSDGCLSNLALDRVLGDEVEGGERAAALSHVETCSRCSTRLRELEAARSAFRAAPPPFSPPAPARPRSPRSMARRTALASVCALAAVALFLFVRAGAGRDPSQPVAQPQPPRAPSADATRVKGGLRLGVYIKRQDTVFEGQSGAVVHPGDAIRFAYTSATGGYLVVLGRDGTGAVSVYYPDGDEAAPIRPAGDELLPGSVVLDAVPGPEEIVLLRCRAPLRVADAMAALRAGAPPSPGAGCEADRVLLDKRP